jgi:hypothetical protein
MLKVRPLDGRDAELAAAIGERIAAEFGGIDIVVETEPEPQGPVPGTCPHCGADEALSCKGTCGAAAAAEPPVFREEGGGDVGKPGLTKAERVRLKEIPPYATVKVALGAEYDIGGWVATHQDPIEMNALEARKRFGV